MVKLTVNIVSMQDADKFNKLCSKFDCDMDLQSGKYYVDAKSIMGIFSNQHTTQGLSTLRFGTVGSQSQS